MIKLKKTLASNVFSLEIDFKGK